MIIKANFITIFSNNCKSSIPFALQVNVAIPYVNGTKEDKALGIKNAIIRESSFDWAKFNQVFLKFYLEKIEAGWHNQL